MFIGGNIQIGVIIFGMLRIKRTKKDSTSSGISLESFTIHLVDCASPDIVMEIDLSTV